MARNRPERARRLVEEAQRYRDHPQAYLYLAVGDERARHAPRHEAFETAMRGIDRLMTGGTRYAPRTRTYGISLPVVEQIDPALSPSYSGGPSPAVRRRSETIPRWII